MGFLLSAFFLVLHCVSTSRGMDGGPVPREMVFGIGFLLWAASTMLSAFAIGLASLAVMRLLLGAGESVAFPCYSKVIAAGFPTEKRGLPNSLLEAGTKLGPALGSLIGGFLVADYGWRVMFFALGLGSLLWLFLGPFGHPARQLAKANSLRLWRWDGCRNGYHHPAARRLGHFHRQLLLHLRLLLLLTWLPFYLVKERHVSLSSMGVIGSIPFWGSAVSAVVCGWASDRWIRRGGSPTKVRKTFVVCGLLLSTVMVPAALVNDLTLSIVLLSVAYIAFGMYASNHWAITQTLAGTAAAGTWTGLQNTVGNLSGILAPIITGVIVSRTGSFYWAFVSPAILSLVGVCCYLFLVGPVEPVKWTMREDLQKRVDVIT